MKKKESIVKRNSGKDPLQKHLAVINVVGLTPELIGEDTPNLKDLAAQRFLQPVQGVFPSVTTTAQSSMLTGLQPADHGIVGNGWYFSLSVHLVGRRMRKIRALHFDCTSYL